MSLELDQAERDVLGGTNGPTAARALSIVLRVAELLGARQLVPIESAHVDGCLLHGEAGVVFAERLVEGGGRVCVPTTLNVGILDHRTPGMVRLDGRRAELARRMRDAYIALGCRPSWTCSPYQAGHRPTLGTHVAWGESNAVAFANSVLGARTNRYGDFIDIACALCGRAPASGLHLDANRIATVAYDVAMLDPRRLDRDETWPVLGADFGRRVGDRVGVVTGVEGKVGEDRLKAFGAAAASTGSVALFHIAGTTPEAPTAEIALGGRKPELGLSIDEEDFAAARRALSSALGDRVDAIAIGSPHLSADEIRTLDRVIAGQTMRLPFFACTGRHALDAVAGEGVVERLESAGVTLVVDTCVVVAPILARVPGGVLMTNSGKFAQYGPGTIGFETLFASLDECVETAVAGRPVLRGG